MSALAEMERELIVERTRAGLAAAREQGRVGGRRRVMSTEVVERCRRMLGTGATRQQVADVTGVGVKTIYKYLPDDRNARLSTVCKSSQVSKSLWWQTIAKKYYSRAAGKTINQFIAEITLGLT